LPPFIGQIFSLGANFFKKYNRDDLYTFCNFYYYNNFLLFYRLTLSLQCDRLISEQGGRLDKKQAPRRKQGVKNDF